MMRKAAIGLSLALLALLLGSGAGFGQALDTAFEIQKTQSLLDQNPGNAVNRQRLVGLYYQQGMQSLGAGDHGSAVQAFQSGLRAGLQPGYALREGDPLINETRYALAYAQVRAGQSADAVLVLEQLIAVAPQMEQARYLLGKTLADAMSSDPFRRGVAVLRVLNTETVGDAKQRATVAAARYQYNMSTLLYALNQGEAALQAMQIVRADLGSSPGATAAENQHHNYAVGVYNLETGNITAALSELENLRSYASDFRLSNGTRIDQVLVSLYYQAALDHLARGDRESAQTALKWLDLAESLEGRDAVDIHHAKALANLILEDMNAYQAELDSIQRVDATYYGRIVIPRS